MGAVVYLVKNKLVCSKLNEEFQLQLDPPGTEILDGAIIESFSAVVPGSVLSTLSS